MRNFNLGFYLNLDLPRRVRLAIMVLGALLLVLVLIGWWGLAQAQRTAEELQTRTLADVSTALGLADSAAQIAALGPRIAEATESYQLQAARHQMDMRFAALSEQVDSLSDRAFRSALEQEVDQLQAQFRQLTEQVEQDLFVRDDLMTYRFELADWQQRVLARTEGRAAQDLGMTLQMYQQALLAAPPLPSLPNGLLADIHARMADQVAQAELADTAGAELETLVEGASERFLARAELLDHRHVLLARTRYQSEALTDVVQGYVGQLQQVLGSQRDTLQGTLLMGRTGLLVVALLAVLALLEGFRLLVRMTPERMERRSPND
ncbi:hypothetical protein E4656_16440 [Natronospirillum operosum]|uniref:Uncharacterized protein n=1 Tax=Natronospirillum operosum TaxID=2759953 RepID=A0A4Z0W8D3_9GAMM|nr:hypothetical protein [Natronospirillum operosum]TGG91308.1 hypothetical protein E4656_16440 [Natronospirillum operosum]